MTTPCQSQLARALTGLVAATLMVAGAAAQQAYTTRPVNLRAGPDRGYPQVAYLGAGEPVYVNGCVEDYRWCDITAGSVRGWAYARFIEYPYQNQRLPIYGNGSTLALPIVSFILGSYWHDNYRNRPFYHRQNHWHDWRPGNRPPQGFQHPTPAPRSPVLERANPGRPLPDPRVLQIPPGTGQ